MNEDIISAEPFTLEVLEREMAAADYQVTLLLAEHASVADGKLFITGAGWTDARNPVGMCGIAMIITLPERYPKPHLEIGVHLMQNGQPILDEDGTPLEIGGTIPLPAAPAETARARVPVALNIGPLDIEPGEYRWRVRIDGYERSAWELPFRVLAQP